MLSYMTASCQIAERKKTLRRSSPKQGRTGQPPRSTTNREAIRVRRRARSKRLPAPTKTAPVNGATRSPAGARRSALMAAATTTTAHGNLEPFIRPTFSTTLVTTPNRQGQDQQDRHGRICLLCVGEGCRHQRHRVAGMAGWDRHPRVARLLLSAGASSGNILAAAVNRPLGAGG